MSEEVLTYFQPLGDSDPVYTARGAADLSAATPALTPLMLNETGKLVAWDGTKAGTAVGLLALSVADSATQVTYFKSGSWRLEDIQWPHGVSDEHLKRNAFVGTALSVM